MPKKSKFTTEQRQFLIDHRRPIPKPSWLILGYLLATAALTHYGIYDASKPDADVTANVTNLAVFNVWLYIVLELVTMVLVGIVAFFYVFAEQATAKNQVYGDKRDELIMNTIRFSNPIYSRIARAFDWVTSTLSFYTIFALILSGWVFWPICLIFMHSLRKLFVAVHHAVVTDLVRKLDPAELHRIRGGIGNVVVQELQESLKELGDVTISKNKLTLQAAAQSILEVTVENGIVKLTEQHYGDPVEHIAMDLALPTVFEAIDTKVRELVARRTQEAA